MKNVKIYLLLCAVPALFSACDGWQSDGNKSGERVMYLNLGGEIKTLDPVLASDLASQYMVANFYDTLLQYNYTARPYKLEPSMLASMPKMGNDRLSYRFKLRDDLCFQESPCFAGDEKERKISSKDVIFSLLRIADARIHSPGYWLLRDKVKGIGKFRKLTSQYPKGDLTPYDKGCEGLKIIDDHTFEIHLDKPYPRLLYVLAMPYTGVVSRRAIKHFGENFTEHPAGSGAFRLANWERRYKIVLERNPNYRRELFPEADTPQDRTRPLPLLDRIVCYQVGQPLTAWLLFLQGELDMSSLSKENFDAVVGKAMKLVPSLAKRGIKMLMTPQFEVNYIGFSFTDPKLGKNLDLRKAISLAYDTEARIKHANYRLVPANGPIPPGVPGHDPKFRNPYSKYDVKQAKELLRKAGYPGGIDPATGEPLEFSFDQTGSSSYHRQLAEMMVGDMRRIGIKIKPVLNSRARFFQKARKGQLQLFRVSWVGDYPDAENFLQLFYGRNAGSCNRAFYRDKTFDRMYEQIVSMPDSPKRTSRYKKMAGYITGKCPWIFESYPVSYQLLHKWLENYHPHDFAFSRWKYLNVDSATRKNARKRFEPIEMRDLRD